LSIAVIDPFGITADPNMPFLARALDPLEVTRQFECRLARLTRERRRLSLRAIRVTRYKPRRRCVIEYDLEAALPDARLQTVVGKANAKGLGASSYDVTKHLWNSGFASDSEDEVSVPEPLGVIPDFQMWFQQKVPGVTATQLLGDAAEGVLTRRIAQAIRKVHQAGVPTVRRHTMADELRILHERLPLVARMEPRWTERVERLLDACDRLGASIAEPPNPCGIHRDFYPDHVIVDRSRLYLLDFDLYCEGDPALDIGNFSGHLTEGSLRTRGDPNMLRDHAEVLEEHFLNLCGDGSRAAIRAYATLTLVRHVFLSTLFPERRPFTAQLLELCEERVGVASPARARKGRTEAYS